MSRAVLTAAGFVAWSLLAHGVRAQTAVGEPATEAVPAAAVPADSTEAPQPAAPPPPAAPAASKGNASGSGQAPAPVAPAQPVARPTSLRAFDVLATFGYGDSTANVYGLQLEPYALSFGLDVGYTWAAGFRLGAYGGYSLGRDIEQTVTPVGSSEAEVTADTASAHGGVSIGYDVPLHFLVLRNTLGLGVSWMRWDFGEPPWPPLGFSDENKSTAGFHMTPGLLLLWPLGLFECGLGFDYFVQTSGQIPNAFMGKLVAGVKL